MVQIRGKKIFRDMWARKGRSVMVILSIMIGVFGVASMMSITDLLRRQLDEDIRVDQISHNHIFVNYGGDGLSAQENRAILDDIETLPGIVAAEGQAIYPVKWQSEQLGNDENDAAMFSFSEPVADAQFEAITRVVDGRYPADGEIAVEPRFAEKHSLEIGDTLTFPNTGAQEWEIVGLLLHPYYTERVLARPSQLAEIGALAALHHERLDGSGYFRGAPAPM